MRTRARASKIVCNTMRAVVTLIILAAATIGLAWDYILDSKTIGNLFRSPSSFPCKEERKETNSSKSSLSTSTGPVVGRLRNSTTTTVTTAPLVGTSTPPRMRNYTAWCPEAKCQNSDLCKPCDRRFLFILSTGRSASTTLTYMLDTLPGVRMSGENNAELQAIRTMIDNVRSRSEWVQNQDKKNAWGHNKVPPGAFACVAQLMMETINPPPTDEQGKLLKQSDDDDYDDSETIIGMKTIRFGHTTNQGKVDSKEQIAALVRWVQEMFPCVRIIININSDVHDLAESQEKLGWYHNDTSATRILQEFVTRLREAAELFGEHQAYLLDSNVWLNNITELNKAIKWLGFHESCFFHELLQFNTKNGYGATKTQIKLNPNCHYVKQ